MESAYVRINFRNFVSILIMVGVILTALCLIRKYVVTPSSVIGNSTANGQLPAAAAIGT